MSSLAVVTGPVAEPVTLAEVKRQLRLELDDTEQDTYLAGLIASARDVAEAFTGRAFVRRTLRQRFDAFPGSSLTPIRLARPPLAEVVSVDYTDTDGAAQTWSSDDYRVSTDSEPGRILPAYGESWPSARLQSDAVTVTFVAGYAPGDGSPTDHAANVPPAIKHALLLYVTQWFDRRLPVADAQMAELPFALKHLLWAHRIVEL